MTETTSRFYTIFDPENDRCKFTSLCVYGSESVRDEVSERSYQSENPGYYRPVSEDEAKAILANQIANVAIWEDATAPEWVVESPHFAPAEEDMVEILSGHNHHIKAMFLRSNSTFAQRSDA